MRCLRPKALFFALFGLSLAAPSVPAQPGALDPAFGDAGVVVIGSENVAAVAVLHTGKLVAVGSTDAPGSDAAAWVFRSDGTPDLSFGDQGAAIFEVEGVVSEFRSVAPHPSGGFAATRWEACPADDCGFIPSILRINADGTLGENWSGGGSTVWVQEDERVIVAGGFQLGFAGFTGVCYARRYLPDGALDPSFGDGGETHVELALNDDDSWTSCRTVALHESGRIVFGTQGGQRVNGTWTTQWWGGLRLLTDGTFDPAFDPVAEVPELNSLRDIAAGPEGRVTLGGVNDFESPTLVRFTEEGALDASFGESGVAELSVPQSSFRTALESEPGGKLLVGSADRVARVLADGSLDAAFGEAGVATIEGAALGEDVSVRDLEVDAQGRIVVLGSVYHAETDTSTGFVVRLLNDAVVENEPSTQLGRLGLSAPAPNPASAQTTLRFTLTEPAPVRLVVYDVLGREVVVLEIGVRPGEQHEAIVDASLLAPGLYIVRLTAGDEVATSRLTVMR